MNRLDRMILSEIIGPFVGSILLFTALFMGADNFLKILEYASHGASPMLLLKFFLIALPPILAFTAPMGMLLATLLGFLRLSGDSEMTALHAAGAPLERIIAPVAVFALVVSGVGSWINDSVVPSSQRTRQAIIEEQKRSMGQISSSQGFNYRQTDTQGHLVALLHAEGPLSAINGGSAFRLEDVTVVYYQNGKPSNVLYTSVAEGTPGEMNWQMPQGFTTLAKTPSGNTIQMKSDVASLRELTVATPEALQASVRPNEELTTPQLREKARILRNSKNEDAAREVEVEMARRYALPFGSFFFALVGAPLGISSQRAGKGLGFGYAVGLSFVYWIMLQFGAALGRFGTLPPGIAVWLPNLLGFAVGATLIWYKRR